MKFKIYAFVFVVTLVIAGLVYAHCHNVDGNPSCEDYFQVQGLYTWDEPYNNTVEYWISPRHGSMPSLTADVNYMANKWSFISFQGGTIQIKLKSSGITQRKANNLDGMNVVSWKPLGQGQGAPLARTYPVESYFGTYRIKERDIGFNYYKAFTTHADTTYGTFCIRNVAAHEWGHFVGLEHVGYTTTKPISSTNCPEYREYTMNKGASTNSHKLESLECEDKYALDQKY